VKGIVVRKAAVQQRGCPGPCMMGQAPHTSTCRRCCVSINVNISQLHACSLRKEPERSSPPPTRCRETECTDGKKIHACRQAMVCPPPHHPTGSENEAEYSAPRAEACSTTRTRKGAQRHKSTAPRPPACCSKICRLDVPYEGGRISVAVEHDAQFDRITTRR